LREDKAKTKKWFFSEEKAEARPAEPASPTLPSMARLLPQAPEIEVFLLLFLQKKKILPFQRNGQ
jgi:hypothetical protein